MVWIDFHDVGVRQRLWSHHWWCLCTEGVLGQSTSQCGREKKLMVTLALDLLDQHTFLRHRIRDHSGFSQDGHTEGRLERQDSKN